MLTDATTGNLITSCTGVTTCNNTTVLCVINTWYDQKGTLSGTACTGGSCDYINTGVGTQEILVLNCLNTTLPCAQAVPSQAAYTSVGSLTQVQPFMISFVGKQTNNNGNYAGIVNLLTGFDHASGNFFIWAGGGSIVAIAATISVYHAAQALFNGNASSTFYIDGSSNAAANIGTGTISAAINHANGNTIGQIVEFGIINGDQSANNSTMNSNQHTYWGF